MEQVPPIPELLWQHIAPPAQAALLVVFAQLQQQIDDLRQQLQQNSSNSSQPPSSDGPHVKPRPARAASGRQRGAQKGHERHERPLLPPDVTLDLHPEHCRGCQQPLGGDDPEPLVHQVWELPPPKPHVTEYRLHRRRCPHCGLSTCATLPPEVQGHTVGPRLQATLALFSSSCRLSKRQVATLADDLFGTPISPGQVCALERATSAAAATPVDAARAYVQTQPANLDETSWRQEGKRGWLWVGVTGLVTVFLLRLSRGSVVVREMLGTSTQVVTSDRYSAYSHLPLGRRQLCWAHLRRDFQAIKERGGSVGAIGQKLLEHSDDLFYWWHCLQRGEIKKPAFERRRRGLRQQIQEQLRAGAADACRKTSGTCVQILKVESALWTFARVAGVGPTNNAAERALRHAVLWRKCSYGTASASGGQFVERMLSVVASCRQQGRNVLGFLTECCAAARTQTAPPSLIPQNNN